MALEKYVPEIGCYQSISNREYHQCWDALNSSRLKEFARCPAQYQYKNANPDAHDKECFRMGSAVDCLTLTPDEFGNEFMVMGEVSLTGTKGRIYKEAFIDEAEAEQKTWLTFPEYQLCVDMADAARKSPLYEMHLARGRAQLSFVWDDQVTGLRCKVRPDSYTHADGIIWDVKTTRHYVERFGKAVAEYDYLLQAAMYADGVFNVTGKFPRFGFYVIGKEPPHYVQAHYVTDEQMQVALERFHNLLKHFKRCQSSNKWPGIDTTVPLSIPQYYADRLSNIN